MAGFIGILKMGKIIISSLSLAFMSLTGKGGVSEEVRTDRDMSPRNAFLVQIGAIAAMFILFWFISGSPAAAAVGTIVTYVLAFLFTPVAARAIAIVGVNPVSGMTMITLIIACLILANTGLLGGELGMSVALIVGCAVCTALATSGAFITDLKVGYWLGASPFQQQRWKYLGILVASLCVGVVIAVLAKSNGFLPVDPVTGLENANPLPAPQGNLMATIVQSVMGGEEQPILLFALGGLVAILLEMAAVAGLAFGLGMYLPIEINLAIFAGALVGHFIGKSGRDEKEKAARKDQGTLIASGLMAGAAIIGVLGSIFKLPMLPEGFTFREPMTYLDIVEHSHLGDGSFAAYFEGFGGMMVSVLGAAALIWGCYRLAVWGGRLQMQEESESGE
jgi:putative OPT family oligopeptide transporter